MIIKIDNKGMFDLKDLFPLKEVRKIHYYCFGKLTKGKVRLYLFDKTKKEIFPKLRKRGKAKKV